MHYPKGRLDHGPPIAVIDIGSNSVRLVVYEALTRAPTAIFNEKVLAGLGREVQTTGLLAEDAIETALEALRRFRALCDILHVRRIWAIATAACRDARNGNAFIRQAERICRTPIKILSGKREANLTALGVVSGMHKPDGIVGDLGGGSLELTRCSRENDLLRRRNHAWEWLIGSEPSCSTNSVARTSSGRSCRANEAFEQQATTVADPGGERNKAAAERGHLFVAWGQRATAGACLLRTQVMQTSVSVSPCTR